MGVAENSSAQEKELLHSQVANKKPWPKDSKSNAKQLFSSPPWVGWECHPHLPSQPSEAFSLPKLPARQQLQLEALETPWPRAKLKLPTWAWSKNLTNPDEWYMKSLVTPWQSHRGWGVVKFVVGGVFKLDVPSVRHRWSDPQGTFWRNLSWISSSSSPLATKT